MVESCSNVGMTCPNHRFTTQGTIAVLGGPHIQRLVWVCYFGVRICIVFSKGTNPTKILIPDLSRSMLHHFYGNQSTFVAKSRKVDGIDIVQYVARF